MINFGVNDGHTISGPGSGAVGKISESKVTREVGKIVRELLKQRGHNAVNCTIDYANSSNEALSLIVQQANRQDLDWFISIHFNAGGGRGVEVYTYQGRQYQDALDVCKNISALGFTNRGVKNGSGLYVVRKTKAKSMLIEVCFVDSADVEQYLKIGARTIAEAIVNGICGVLPVKEKSKFPLPLKMLCNTVAIGFKDGKPYPVKEFKQGDLITARNEINKLYELDIKGEKAYIPAGYTTNR